MKNEVEPMAPNGQARNKFEALCRIGTCTLSNAIERCNFRPRNEGFMAHGPVCRFPGQPPVAGHAITGRIQTYMPPVTGKCYYDHIEWWRYVETIPEPRIIVLHDFDHRPGFGALFGEVHARISKALRCVAYVTNGAVRDLDGIEALGFQLFSGSVAVSHSYAHIVDFGEAIEIGGLEIKPGDILHGDRHGILSVPPQLVDRLPEAVKQIECEEKRLFDLTQNPDFSADMLANALREFADKQECS
jgi:4-hydroxy-4-methyl-2-oxoglutarate aldolase